MSSLAALLTECEFEYPEISIDDLKASVHLMRLNDEYCRIRVVYKEQDLFCQRVKHEELESVLKGLKNRVLWNRTLIKENPAPALKKYNDIMDTDCTCYVCYEVADTKTPCNHKLCSKCFLNMIKVDEDGPTIKCGMCQSVFIDCYDEGWIEI